MDALGQRKIFYLCLELNYNSLSLVVKSRAAQIFQKWGKLKISDTRRVTWIKSHTENTQITGAIVQNLAATAMWKLGFVHP